MKKLLPKSINIKILTTIRFLFFSSALSLFLIALLGYNGMKKINVNSNEMYEKRLIAITQLDSIKENLQTIRLSGSNAVLRYHSNHSEIIKATDTLVKAQIDQYKSAGLDVEETRKIELFVSLYSDYMNKWKDIESALSSGTLPMQSSIDMFSSDGDMLFKTLSALSEYDREAAKKLNVENNKVYKDYIFMFFIIYVVSTLILLLVSLLTIRITKKDMTQMKNHLDEVAECNFSIAINTSARNEFGIMRSRLAKAISEVSSILSAVIHTSNEINKDSEILSEVAQKMSIASEGIAQAISEVSAGSSTQSEDLSNINVTLNQFGEQIEQISASIQEVEQNAGSINLMAKDSNNTLRQLVDSIHGISASFNNASARILSLNNHIGKINAIINTINSIAEQTNLLALNAAIEAARAGEAGRGFSVVAEEIRKLSEESKQSSSSISALLKGISTEAGTAASTTQNVNSELTGQIENINNSLDSFRRIITSIEEIMPKISIINNYSRNVNRDKDNILSKLEAASAVSEQSSASIQEIAAAYQEINTLSDEVASTASALTILTRDSMEKMKKFKI